MARRYRTDELPELAADWLVDIGREERDLWKSLIYQLHDHQHFVRAVGGDDNACTIASLALNGLAALGKHQPPSIDLTFKPSMN